MRYMARSCQHGSTISVFGNTHLGMHICCRHDRMHMEVRRPSAQRTFIGISSICVL